MAKKKIKMEIVNPNAAGIDVGSKSHYRITSYNVCYTKLLRVPRETRWCCAEVEIIGGLILFGRGLKILIEHIV